jgi:hypothetical protein
VKNIKEENILNELASVVVGEQKESTRNIEDKVGERDE